MNLITLFFVLFFIGLVGAWIAIVRFILYLERWSRYNWMRLIIVGGAGAGQERTIIGSTETSLYISEAW